MKVIFAYDQLEDGVLPEVEVLASMLSYFRPLPPGLLEHVKYSPWSVVLMNLNESFDTENPATPLGLWTDIDGLETSDKDFIGRILNLDPALRPSAEELLKDEWFSRPERIHLPPSYST
jgi:serine/threonine protein kinase